MLNELDGDIASPTFNPLPDKMSNNVFKAIDQHYYQPKKRSVSQIVRFQNTQASPSRKVIDLNINDSLPKMS